MNESGKDLKSKRDRYINYEYAAISLAVSLLVAIGAVDLALFNGKEPFVDGNGMLLMGLGAGVSAFFSTVYRDLQKFYEGHYNSYPSLYQQ